MSPPANGTVASPASKSGRKPSLAVKINMPNTQNPPSPPPTAVGAEASATATVSELLSTMKNTVSALSKTFEMLGDQTTRVSELQPAMEASQQVLNIRTKLQQQYAEQEARIEQIKKFIRDGIKERINTKVKPRLHAIIASKVEEKVKERVRQELIAQIPDNLRQEIKSNRRQILQIQTTLHNSEARRKNSRIVTKSSEPLSALRRPYPLTAEEPPTPSDLFPDSIQKLLDLSADELRALAKDYELVDSSSPAVGVGDESAETHYKLLNKIMDHMGIQYQAVPTVPGSRPLLFPKQARTD